jgi:hypothetical protein
MVVDEHADGRRIGQHLSSEIHGHERGVLGALAVVDADADAEPSEAGTVAFAVAVEGETGSDAGAGDGTPIAEVYLHPDRIRVEFSVLPELAAEAGADAGLRVRSKDVEPPRTLVFVERVAEVKAALRAVERVTEQFLDDIG